MTVLHRKLIRDLLGSIGMLLSVVIIIAIGTGSFIGMASAQRILEASRAAYYREYRFADFWVDVKKAPISALDRIARLSGVAVLDNRVVFDVILNLEGQVRPLAGRLISTPAGRFDRTLNGIHLVRGSGFSDDRNEEVILSEAFARAHHLRIGDRIELILNRKRESFTIVGTAISPEYVYMVRGPGDLIPDPVHFGVLYVKDSYAREVLDFKDACNQIVGSLAPGARGDMDVLLGRIDRALSSYGVLEITPRQRQASHRFLSDEITGLAVTATIMPAIFLGVAALVLNILMIRMAQRQRTTIGTLKALGYSDRSVMVHFLSFGLVVGIVGGLAGAALGTLLAYVMIEMYAEFFQFPRFVFRAYPDLLLIGMAISVAFAVAGTARGVWEVLKLRPAEAMREKPPERGGAIFLERFPRLWHVMGFRTHIALRTVFRNRTRTLTAVIATALSTAIIFMSMATYDAFLYLVDYQFDKVAHSDVDIGLRDEKSVLALFESRALPGVDYAEPLLGLRCDLRHGRNARRMTIIGLSSRHRLITPLRADGKPVQIPGEGLVLSRKLAELLGVRLGDSLELTPVRGRRETSRVRVASIVETFLGMDCYADVRYLSRIVGESLAVNSVQLAVSAPQVPVLYEAIKELPNAQGLSVRTDAKDIIETTLVETSLFSIGVMVLFAGMIAFGSTVNNALIEIGDRIREISTLRVLGYRPGQIAGILFRESMLTFMAGLALACPLGYGMLHLIAAAYDSELYRMPVVIRPIVVLYTFVLVALFVLLAQWIVLLQIRKLDWLQGMKVKE
ncbi:MAG: FtsX-like permease family protein [Phycisphaerales bacterium]|nr:MAG: FtsX-like permease family protein [Phycisphaerales bacterium]